MLAATPAMQPDTCEAVPIPLAPAWSDLEPGLWAQVLTHITHRKTQLSCMLACKLFNSLGLENFTAFRTIKVREDRNKDVMGLSRLLYKLHQARRVELAVYDKSKHMVVALAFAAALKLPANLYLTGEDSLVLPSLASWVDLAAGVTQLCLSLPATSPLWSQWMQLRAFDRFSNLTHLTTLLADSDLEQLQQPPAISYTLSLPKAQEWTTELTTTVPQPWVSILTADVNGAAFLDSSLFPNAIITEFRGTAAPYRNAPPYTRVLIIWDEGRGALLEHPNELPSHLELLACCVGAPGIRHTHLPPGVQHNGLTTLFLKMDTDCVNGAPPFFGCTWPPLLALKAAFPNLKDVVVSICWPEGGDMIHVPPEVPAGLRCLYVQYVVQRPMTQPEKFLKSIGLFTFPLSRLARPRNLCVDTLSLAADGGRIQRIRLMKFGFEACPEADLLRDWRGGFHMAASEFSNFAKSFVNLS